MPMTFDSNAIEGYGWRQGAVLGPELLKAARERAPSSLVVVDDNWLIVTSHDCDVVNKHLDKEPAVEILRAETVIRKTLDKQQVGGRNPRIMQIAVEDGIGCTVILSVRGHERWTLPREILATEAPVRVLGIKERRLIAEWLAKRYIRAAFPTAFDGRWRTALREWTSLLEKHSRWVQGIYLRLSTLSELDAGTPYKVDLIVAAPAAAKKGPGWVAKRDEIEREVETFWTRFVPGIECAGVDVRGTDEVTLDEIEQYQRFDADWVSFTDDSPRMPAIVDMMT
jgi:hypothetical protein